MYISVTSIEPYIQEIIIITIIIFTIVFVMCQSMAVYAQGENLWVTQYS